LSLQYNSKKSKSKTTSWTIELPDPLSDRVVKEQPKDGLGYDKITRFVEAKLLR
jgi:hypothetical protein